MAIISLLGKPFPGIAFSKSACSNYQHRNNVILAVKISHFFHDIQLFFSRFKYFSQSFQDYITAKRVSNRWKSDLKQHKHSLLTKVPVLHRCYPVASHIKINHHHGKKYKSDGHRNLLLRINWVSSFPFPEFLVQFS